MKKMVKRLTLMLMLSAVFVLAMSAAVFAEGSQHEEKIKYINERGDEARTDYYEFLDNVADEGTPQMYWENSHAHESTYILKHSKVFNNRLNAYGNVDLILCDGVTLNCKKGIHVPPGSKLRIYAQSTGGNMGMIIADASTEDYCAGIGGNEDETPDGITIIGGNIKATGGMYGAGIGGGDEGLGGNIEIMGGDVKGYGGQQAAGIGGGDKGSAGRIAISGGKVYGKSGRIMLGLFTTTNSGAGIGGGRCGNAGEITITGGEVTGEGGHRGAGIGSGGDNDQSKRSYSGFCKGGKIVITGGTVYGNGLNGSVGLRNGGAGIGSGADSFGVEISISGGNVWAQGSYYDYSGEASTTRLEKPGAAIGNGYDTISPSQVSIFGSSESRTKIHCESSHIYSVRIPAIGNSSANEDNCAVMLSYSEAKVDVYGKYIAKKEQRLDAIQEAWTVDITYCDHADATFDITDSKHTMHCPYCDTIISNDDHVYEDDYVIDEANHNHYKKCTVCGYHGHVGDHEFDSDTGKCVCGLQALSVTVKPGDAEGTEKKFWLMAKSKYELPDPASKEIGFTVPEGTTFKGWKINGDVAVKPAGTKITINSDTELVSVYSTAWATFKANVESAKNGATVTLPSDTQALETDTHIVIKSGRKVTVDLKGHTLDREAASLIGHKDPEGIYDGDIFLIEEGGELILTDSSEGKTGVITDGSVIEPDESGEKISTKILAGGAVTVKGGKFTLEGGTIKSNFSAGGAGVNVSDGGSFTMTGGAISNNMSYWKGSGVYVDNGTFTMTGGTISDNYSFEPDTVTAGVQIEKSGSFNVSGSAVVQDNHDILKDDKGEKFYGNTNVYLAKDQTVKVDGALSGDARIGVITEVKPAKSGQNLVQISSGLNSSNVDSFISDDAAYAVVSEGKEAYLGFKDVEGSPHAVKVEVETADGAAHGTAAAGNTAGYEGDKISLTAIPDDDYEFAGWTLESGEGASIEGTDAAEATLTMGTEDVVVKASFRKIEEKKATDFTVNVKDGDTMTPVKEGGKIELALGDTLQLALTPVPEDAKLKDITWTDGDSGAIAAVDENGKVTPKKAGLTSVSVTANGITKEIKISVSGLTVTFDPAGGEGAVGEKYVAAGSTVAKPEADPERDGYKFLGWRKVTKAEDGTETVDTENYDFEQAVRSDLTLRAAWEHADHAKTLRHTDAKAPSCDADGNAEYWQCEECGKYFADKDAKNEYSENAWVIPALGHQMTGWKSDGNAADSTHSRECNICHGADTKETEAHTWDKGEVTKAPTKEAAGEITFTCKTCGETRTETVDQLADNDHYIDVTKEGKGKVSCSPVKGPEGTEVTLTAEEADGYEFAGWEVTGTTCEKTNTRRTKIVIGDSDIQVKAIFKEHHTVIAVDGKEATCTEEGYEPYFEDRDTGILYADEACTDEIEKPVSIPALGHDWGEWEVTRDATTTQDGEEARTCTRCGEVETRSIPKVDPGHTHSWDNGKVTRKATLTSEGVLTITCKECGATKTESIAKVRLGTPRIKTQAKQTKKMSVSWAKVAGATGYKVAYRKIGSSKWKIKTTRKTSVILKGKEDGRLYQYKVAAVRNATATTAKVTGKYSGITHRFYRSVKNLKVRGRKNALKVTWKKTKGAKGYEIWLSESPNFSRCKRIAVKGGSKTKYTIKGLKKGKMYYVRIRPLKPRGGKTYIGIVSGMRKAAAK